MRFVCCLAVLLASGAQAQVVRSQTISALDGGFPGTLADGDRFGVSAAALGDLSGDGTVELAVGADLADEHRLRQVYDAF